MKRSFNHKKATQLLNFFALREGGTINKMKSLKLLWLADRLHLRMYGRSISNDNYMAMKNGPVASSAKDIAENSTFCSTEESTYGQDFIRLNPENKYLLDSVSEVDFKVFSKTDVSALEKVYEAFGDKDEFELSDVSHLYPEWKRWESQLAVNASSRYNIIESDFFTDPESDNEKSGNDSLFRESKERLEANKAMYFSR